LRNRSPGRDLLGKPPSAIVTKTPASTGGSQIKKESQGPSPEKLLERARQAESAGKRELALAYLRVARDQGSSEARQEFERLTRKTR
jgi:hypothetical protein